MKKTILSSIVLLSLSWSVSAQQDVANSKDHALLSRYEGSWINRYSFKEYEVYTYPLSREMVDYDKLKDNKSIEGQITAIEYVAPEGVTATQVYRTYQERLTKAGFKIIFSCRTADCGDMPMHFSREYVKGSSQLGNTMVGSNGSYLLASGTYNNEPYFVSLLVGDDKRGNMARYHIDIVKQELLDTDKVDVAAVSDGMENEGRYAFYGINFDLNSAEIREDSADALKVMADYLLAHPEANVLVVGHTDNTGDFDLNMSLSQKRAASVVAALVKNFQIDGKQLTAVGVGMASPLASNRDEAGRVRNRRVELVIK